MTGTSRSPVPDEVADELARVARRWQQLPLDDARRRLPEVRALVEELAGEPVPDLGPGVVIDQLRVVVYDACRAGTKSGERAPDAARRLDGIRERLAELRRSL